MKRGRIAQMARLAALPALAVIILAGSYFRVLDSYELETIDARFRLRPQIATSDKVVIVEIGDDTIAKIGRFPFDRSYHAVLTEALAGSGARSIVFDLFFSEPQVSDDLFARAVRKAGNVYFPIVFELTGGKAGGITFAENEAAANLEKFNRNAKGLGHINVIPDIDGKYRRAPAYIRCGEFVYPYLPIRVACDYLGVAQKDVKFRPGRSVDIGDKVRIPLDEDSLMLVNFSGGWGKTYKHYSYVDILQSYLAKDTGEAPNIDLSVFNGKVCVIGLTAVGTVDLHPNPFDALYPAMGMHAETFSSIVRNIFIARLGRGANLAILALLLAAVSALVLKTKPLRGLFILSSAIATYVLVCVLIFDHSGIWVDIAYPVIAIVLLHLALTLYQYVREWQRRLLMENELGIAKKIQESFLPASVPSVPGVDVAAAIFTARQVGGDLYDFVRFGEGSRRFGVMIGDVSGKGVPAALFMALVTGAFRTFSALDIRPEEVLERLNAKLIRESASNLFVTMSYMIFDVEGRSAVYGNGGHLPALYLPKRGQAEFLDVTDGAPLGLIEGPYSASRKGFGPGDTFIFYTDGITEAMNARSDMYGRQRLQAVAEKNMGLGAAKLLAAIEKDVRKFEPQNRQHDDMTVIVVRMA